MRILYSLLLVGVTVVWGWTFVVVQDAIALFGYWLAGDRLIALQAFGAALILSALLVCEVLPALPIK